MRINIKTPAKVKDRDIRVLYILDYALNLSTSSRMKIANLEYTADRLGYKLVKK